MAARNQPSFSTNLAISSGQAVLALTQLMRWHQPVQLSLAEQHPCAWDLCWTSKLHSYCLLLALCSYSLQLDEAQSNVTIRFREQVFQLQSQLDQQKISHEQQMLVTTQAHSFPYNATVCRSLFAVSWLKTLVLNCEDVLILQWRREKPLCSKHRSCLTS